MLNEGRGGMEVFGLERNSSRSNDRGVIAKFGKMEDEIVGNEFWLKEAKKCDTRREWSLEIRIEKREAKIQIKCIDK